MSYNRNLNSYFVVVVNLQFPYITSANSFKMEDQVSTLKSGRHLTDGRPPRTHALGLTNCADVKAIGWSVEALDQDLKQICWREKLSNRHQPFCLYKRESRVAS